ncbi:MAG: TetR family transcriptional regulator [Lachnospiraceae bacterium]
MPKKRFNRLDSKKQEIIINAIVTEYHRTAYGELHFSKIARMAKISRSSLYTYFVDKEDMFLFAVEKGARKKERTF